MLAQLIRTALPSLLLFLYHPAQAQQQDQQQPQPATVTHPFEEELVPPELAEVTREPWLDRYHYNLYWALWRSAMGIDRLFGGEADVAEYQDVAGSLAPALLWDEFDGFQPKLRFRVKLPLPQFDERFDAFVGRVNRDEFVTERQRESGALPNQRGAPVEDDETLVGIRFSEPKHRNRFQASGGVRVRTPLDPYVKASWWYQHGKLEGALITLRETGFWQNSEDFGFTSRVDLEHVFEDKWHTRFSASGTISEQSEGVRGYAGVTVLRELSRRRAAVMEIFVNGEVDADVPVGDYGVKVAYRKSVIRDWLVLETRTSVSWPKDEPDVAREPSWGVGVGLEVFFGTEEFQSRPVTF